MPSLCPENGKKNEVSIFSLNMLPTLSLKDLSIMSSVGNSLLIISSYKSLLWQISSSVRIVFLKYFLVLKMSQLVVRSVWTIVGRGWSCLHEEPLLTGENRRLMEPLEELLSVPESSHWFFVRNKWSWYFMEYIQITWHMNKLRFVDAIWWQSKSFKLMKYID